MEITFIVVGKTNASFLQKGEDEYCERLKHYCKFSYETIPDLKNAKKLSENQKKAEEGTLILKRIQPNDYIVLLDERGKVQTSKQLARFVQQHQMQATRRLVFIVGGAYGFSDEVYKSANQKLSLSSMTFSHQMVRLFFLEQLYRAYTILKGEPYHHG